MPTNRDAIREEDLVKVEERPRLFGFFGTIRIDEGFQAVVTADGAWQHTIGPGVRQLTGYDFAAQIKTHTVDCRARPLVVEVINELAIRQPVIVPVQRM